MCGGVHKKPIPYKGGQFADLGGPGGGAAGKKEGGGGCF